MDEQQHERKNEPQNRDASVRRDPETADELSRRREAQQRPPLTTRERSERWPIG